jgi:membrane protease YdiL (CAAX protease family)
VLASVLFHIPAPFVRANLHVLVALGFLLAPQLLARRQTPQPAYGLTTAGWARSLGAGVLAILIVLPLFAVVFYVYNRLLCQWAPTLVMGSCQRLGHPVFRLPHDIVSVAAAQLIVVAIPEELFFRGYLQTRLDEALPPRRTLWGAPVGWGLPLGAALFALGHYLVSFEPQMLSRFFPGLAFGWLFARTKSVVGGALFHAACNVAVDVLALTFLT